jgi:hypothetical protein
MSVLIGHDRFVRTIDTLQPQTVAGIGISLNYANFCKVTSLTAIATCGGRRYLDDGPDPSTNAITNSAQTVCSRSLSSRSVP